MSRTIEEIKDELETVSLRLNNVIDEMNIINIRGHALDERRRYLLIELEEAQEKERENGF